MADKIRKSRPNSDGKFNNRRKTTKITAGKTKSTGPRLPAALRKELDTIRNPNLDNNSDDDDIFGDNDEEIDSDIGEIKNDFYEYEEEVAEEESSRNRRYDPVDNFDYQLPENFKDEDVPSEDNDDDDISGNDDGEQDKDFDDDERHARMLLDITGIPAEAFEGQKRKRKGVVLESYPESEFNPSTDVLSGDGKITIHDLLGPLSETSGFSKLSNKILRAEKKGTRVLTPLPKPVQDKLDRETAYADTRKYITKWEGQIKRNREARTLFFDNKNEIRVPTVGTIASEFKPRTDYEKIIASLMHDDDIVDAYRNDGIKLLEMNKVSVEDVKDRQDKLAKMRSVFFHHEMKAKRFKKIKSKTYRRMKKKDKMKASGSDSLTDPEAAKELAEKKQRERAEARATLKHKNEGKWAKRVLKRGLDKQDEGTRAAMSEQLHMHNLLTRKMNSMKDGSSDDDSTDEDDDVDSSDEEGASKLLTLAKKETIKLMEQEDEDPKSGVFSMPFMVRELEKRKEAANEEAKHALEDYELSLNQQDEKSGKGLKHGTLSGKRVFGATQKKVEEPRKRQRPEVDNYGSENEDIIEENDSHVAVEGNYLHKDVDVNLDVLREDLETGQEPAFETVNDITVEDPGSRTSFDVSVFAAGSWKKMKSTMNQRNTTLEGNAKHISESAKPSQLNGVREEVDEDSDSDSGGQMVDGMLSSGAKQTYELPSNDELIRRAFAGDDVDEEFHKAKEDVLNEENPEPEKPLLLPGWGQWSSVQKKRGIPSWISKEHANAKQKREAALKKRKDARLAHVIISEKVDKQAEKLYLKTLPYPYTSEEVFHQASRMPLGPEFNPATVAGALTRPEVVKKSGIIIPPISFEEVNPHEKGEDDTKQGKKRRQQNGKNSGKKPKLAGSKRT